MLLLSVCLLSLLAVACELLWDGGPLAFVGLLFGRCVVVGVLPALAVVAAHSWLSAARSGRASRARGYAGAALCAACALLVPLGGHWFERLAERRQVALLARVDQRAAPLITALRAYTRDHGAAPRKLSAVVPDYLPRLPSTGAPRDRAFGYDPSAGWRHHYRLAGGGELCLWLAGRLHDAELIGAQSVAGAVFDPRLWRRDRSPAQAAAFVELSRQGLSRLTALSMLGLPDWRDAPPEGAWSLDASVFTGRRGRGVLYVPFERYPQSSADGRERRLGRWWLYDY
ncbi:MAG: hypothetical protein HZB16_19665 [Armatimonadetes bacterium]|nr:hypothetical protein [Armatimonadota bacterium]